MIDLQQDVGSRVTFIGPRYEDYPMEPGTIGVIEYVDDNDTYMTYKVKFPEHDWAIWVGNNRLEALVPDDVEMCGWKPRALKAEAELKELRAALKTLSEG